MLRPIFVIFVASCMIACSSFNPTFVKVTSADKSKAVKAIEKVAQRDRDFRN